MDLEKKQVMYRKDQQRKGEHSKSQRSPIAILDQLEYEINLLEDELDELKAYKKKLEVTIEIRKNVSQKLEMHKYGSGIVVITIVENEIVFEFNPMVINRCTKSYCMRIEDLDEGAFSVLKYYMPIYMNVRELLKKPEFENNILKYLNHIHSCLIAYNDRKHQVMQAEKSLKGIKIANTMDYRLLEITLSMEENTNKQVTVVIVLKYEDNEVRPSIISVECKDLSNETSEEIRAQLKDLQIYSLEIGLQLSLLKNESSQSSGNLNNVDSETSIESATTVELPQNNFRHLQVQLGIYKRVRGRGRRSLQQHSAESELETSEEEEDQSKRKPRRGRSSRGRGRGKHVPFSKQVQEESGDRKRGVRGRGRGRGGRRGSNKGKTLDISKYFERSNTSQ